MAEPFLFEHDLAFDPARAAEQLRELPEADGVLALFGPAPAEGSPAQPYLMRTANLRRRAQRLLNPPLVREQATTPNGTPLPARRLNLRDRVARVAWSRTGSEFESLLRLYHATASLFSVEEARRRLKLRTPYFVRFAIENVHPRVYVTNRLSRRGLAQTYGPFPSRAAAERYCDAALDLFKLRRCYEDLRVHPEHPGCAYGEMKMCLAPCNLSCTAEQYAAEAEEVERFFGTHGESLLAAVAREREAASESMDFERAAALHTRHEKVKAAAALADEIVRPLLDLRAAIVQAAARQPERADDAALFLLERGCLAGPKRLSTLGVRAVKEQTAVGSSLFAQPLMLAAVPLEPLRPDPQPGEQGALALSPEHRATSALAALEQKVQHGEPDLALLSDHLALLRRWYYRPEKQRAGELFLPNPDGSWPVRRILRGAARTVLGDPKTMQSTDREGARELKTKLLHAGREGVERSVPVLERGALPLTPESSPSSAEPPVFRSRRSRKHASSVINEAANPADKLAAP